MLNYPVRVGSRPGRRAPGTGGVRDERTRTDTRNHTDQKFLGCVSTVAETFGQMADSVAGGN